MSDGFENMTVLRVKACTSEIKVNKYMFGDILFNDFGDYWLYGDDWREVDGFPQHPSIACY